MYVCASPMQPTHFFTLFVHMYVRVNVHVSCLCKVVSVLTFVHNRFFVATASSSFSTIEFTRLLLLLLFFFLFFIDFFEVTTKLLSFRQGMGHLRNVRNVTQDPNVVCMYVACVSSNFFFLNVITT